MRERAQISGRGEKVKLWRRRWWGRRKEGE
jgi:hypothetical protein